MYRYHDLRTMAFSLSEANLRRIEKAVSSAGGAPTWRYSTHDGRVEIGQSLESVLAAGNRPPSTLRCMGVASGPGAGPRVEVEFESRPLGPSVSLRVEGEDDSAPSLASELRAELVSTRPWYSPIACQQGLISWLLSIGFLGWLWTMFALTNGSRPISEVTVLPVGAGVLALALLVGLVALIAGVYAAAWLLERALLRLCPPAEFVIGDGVRRHDAGVFWRRIVGATLGLGFVASLAAGLALR